MQLSPPGVANTPHPASAPAGTAGSPAPPAGLRLQVLPRRRLELPRELLTVTQNLQTTQNIHLSSGLGPPTVQRCRLPANSGWPELPHRGPSRTLRASTGPATRPGLEGGPADQAGHQTRSSPSGTARDKYLNEGGRRKAFRLELPRTTHH